MTERDAQQIDQIRLWEKEKPTTNAVAVYGTSIEDLIQIVKTGVVQPFPRTSLHINYHGLEYLEPDDLLYYFTLIGPNLEKTSPNVYKQVCSRYPGWNNDEIEYETSEKKAIRTAKGYALWNALTDHFNSETGLHIGNNTTLLFIAHKLAVKGFGKYYKEVEEHMTFSPDEFERHATSEEAKLIESNVSKDDVVKIIKEGFKRRGVILFYNSMILDGRLLEFYEEESELLIASKNPLKSDVIAGIQILSEADREALVSACSSVVPNL